MLERIIKFFDKKQSQSDFSDRTVFDAGQYGLTPKMISRNAHQVVETLQNAGFEAYVVGGSVRDLLLGLKPKDFDVATNAEPTEIKSLFRRSRIIGRRFQIVHVQFSRELIEVTTFRSNQDSDIKASKKNAPLRQQSKSGMLTRDNVFGSVTDDAERRDLTVNALYYDPSDNTIHDFTDGLKLRWPAGQWLLIRPSNTEPIIRVIAEASTLTAAQELCQQATTAIESDNR